MLKYEETKGGGVRAGVFSSFFFFCFVGLILRLACIFGGEF